MQSKKLAKPKPGPATQRYLDIAEIRDDVVVMKDGTLRAIIMVASINFALKSEEEQEAIVQAYMSFLSCFMRLPFDTDQWFEPGYLFCQSCIMCGFDDFAYIFVGAGGLFGDAAHRPAANQDALVGEPTDDLFAVPFFRRSPAAHVASGAVTGRAKRKTSASFSSG